MLAALSAVAAHLPPGLPQYRIKLGPFIVPPTQMVGLVISARINGGPPLRLLLDSGAQDIVLDRKVAEKSRCAGQGDLDLVAAGVPAARVVKVQRAETIQVGELTLHDLPVVIEDRRLADGIQGALPLSIFAGYVIRLDIPAKTLDLLPYPLERDEPAGAIESIANHHVVFVKGTANGSGRGHFLIDTGASYNAISRIMAKELGISETMAEHVSVEAGTAPLDAAILRGLVDLRVGSQQLPADPTIVVDLAMASRYHGIEISGLIGFPALRGSVLTVSYRDSFVRIEPR